MTGFVLDCSITMAWCFEDQADDETDAVLDAFSHSSAIVPAIWSYEVANVLLVAERQKGITSADSVRFLELLNKLPIEIVEEGGLRLSEFLISLGRSHRLSSYDAAYLHLAIHRGVPLATRDKRLLAAAKRSGTRIYRGA